MLLGGATLGMKAIGIVSTVFLARLLDPGDFGLVALALVLISTSILFSGVGMRQAIIQTKIEMNSAAYHAFMITLLAGMTFTLVVFFGADILADLLGMQQTAPLLRAMSVIILFQSLAVVPEALLQKDLLFARVSGSMIAPELFYLLAAVGFAFGGSGLWSLVYAGILRASLRLVILLRMFPERPWLKPQRIDWSVIKSLVRFGLQTTGSGFVSFFNSIADNLFVGKVFGVTPLGFYGKAYDFSTHTVDSFTKVLGGVLFPSYSLIQEDRQRLSAAYIKSLNLVALITIPASTGMFVVAHELISTLFGEKWIPMVACFQILSIMCIIRALSSTVSPVFLSMGRPEYDLKAGLLVTFIAFPGMFMLQSMGIEGVALAFLIAHVLGYFYNMYQLNKLLPTTANKIVAALGPALFGSFIMALTVYGLRSMGHAFFGSGQSTAGLMCLVLGGCIAYILSVFLTYRTVFNETVILLRTSLKLKATP